MQQLHPLFHPRCSRSKMIETSRYWRLSLMRTTIGIRRTSIPPVSIDIRAHILISTGAFPTNILIGLRQCNGIGINRLPRASDFHRIGFDRGRFSTPLSSSSVAQYYKYRTSPAPCAFTLPETDSISTSYRHTFRFRRRYTTVRYKFFRFVSFIRL